MNLFSGSVAGACAAIVRLICGLVVVKLFAVYLGPAGTAIVAQLQSFVVAVVSIAGAGFGLGIVKYSAEFRSDALRKRNILSAAFAVTLICSGVTAAILWYAREALAEGLLGERSRGPAFGVLALCLLPMAVNWFFLNVLNGHKAILPYTIAIVAGSIFTAALQAFLTPIMGLQGALLAAATGHAPILLVTMVFVTRKEWFRFGDLLLGIDRNSLYLLANFSVMALVTAATIPTSHIVIREYLSQAVSLDAAGIWYGMTRISDVYLMVVTQALITYYLPRLAELDRSEDLRKEVFRGYMTLVPIAATGAAVIYSLRYSIVHIVFDEAFSPMTDLFAFQLIGDVLKIASYVLAMLMLAKSMTRFYVTTEVAFAVLFVAVSIYCVEWFGLVGMAYSHAFLHLIYLATMSLVMRRVLGFESRKRQAQET